LLLNTSCRHAALAPRSYMVNKLNNCQMQMTGEIVIENPLVARMVVIWRGAEVTVVLLAILFEKTLDGGGCIRGCAGDG
jgi:hypothetical protein